MPLPSLVLALNPCSPADNVYPTVLSPGDVVQISLQFSTRVSVLGLVRLILRGQAAVEDQDGFCYANYYSGNNTDTIQFNYFIALDSGSPRLDCAGVDSVDSTYGYIARYKSLHITILLYTHPHTHCTPHPLSIINHSYIYLFPTSLSPYSHPLPPPRPPPDHSNPPPFPPLHFPLIPPSPDTRRAPSSPLSL